MSDRDSILTHLTRQLKRRLPAWLNPTVSLVALALLVFAGALAWTPPHRTFAQESTPTATPTQTPGAAFAVASTAAKAAVTAKPEVTVTPGFKPTRTPTAIPLEWQNNEKETDGVILGAVVLVLIIIGGTLHAIRSNGR